VARKRAAEMRYTWVHKYPDSGIFHHHYHDNSGLRRALPQHNVRKIDMRDVYGGKHNCYAVEILDWVDTRTRYFCVYVWFVCPPCDYHELSFRMCLEQVGILVLALPMVIISQAIEETVKEENVMGKERERRLKVILLERAQSSRNSEVIDPTNSAEHHKDRILMAVEKDIERLDDEKAEREQYDVEVARVLLLHLMDDLGEITGDSRFEAAAEVLLKPADYYTR
jgi:hypothetical protein